MENYNLSLLANFVSSVVSAKIAWDYIDPPGPFVNNLSGFKSANAVGKTVAVIGAVSGVAIVSTVLAHPLATYGMHYAYTSLSVLGSNLLTSVSLGKIGMTHIGFAMSGLKVAKKAYAQGIQSITAQEVLGLVIPGMMMAYSALNPAPAVASTGSYMPAFVIDSFEDFQSFVMDHGGKVNLGLAALYSVIGCVTGTKGLVKYVGLKVYDGVAVVSAVAGSAFLAAGVFTGVAGVGVMGATMIVAPYALKYGAQKAVTQTDPLITWDEYAPLKIGIAILPLSLAAVAVTNVGISALAVNAIVPSFYGAKFAANHPHIASVASTVAGVALSGAIGSAKPAVYGAGLSASIEAAAWVKEQFNIMGGLDLSGMSFS